MGGVPVAPSVRARSAGYSLRRQYFSKAPGFMLPIAETTAIGDHRKTRLIRSRVARKRKARLTRLRVVRKRKARLTRLRVEEKEKVRLTKLRVARNRKVNNFQRWVSEDEFSNN